MNGLMIEEGSLDKVKGNMVKFYEIYDNSTYGRLCMDENSRTVDDEKWYKPRSAQVNAFIANVDKWISQTENPHDPSVATYFAAQKEDPDTLAGPADCEKGEHGADTNTKANVENSDGLSVSGM